MTKHDEITFFSDSLYVVHSFNVWIHGWLRQDWSVPIANKSLIKTIWSLLQRLKKFYFVHVKGHSNIEFNELADSLSTRYNL